MNGHLSTKTALARSQIHRHITADRTSPDRCWLIQRSTQRGVDLCTRSKKGGGGREGTWGETWKSSLPSCSWLVLPFRNESRNLGVLWANTNVVTWILYTGGLQVWLGCSWIFQEQWMRTLPARWFLSPRLKDLGLFDCVGGWFLDRRRDWNLE